MINEVIIKLILAISIALLFVDILVIVSKLVIFVAMAIAKNNAHVSLTPQIWFAGILSLLIATYFIFL